jgi:ABC-type multidrug transport system ATPase subunit
MMTLELSSIAKTYNGRRVLHDVSFSASPGDVVGILGANGSGKSTLVKVIAGVIRADSGTVTCIHDGRELDAQARRASCGFVAPYLALYEEFTPHEHLQLHANLHGTPCTPEHIAATLALVQIDHRAHDRIHTFSSGMKQRVALACAVFLDPPLLLLDEPGSTLDVAGRDVCEAIVRNQTRRGGITILATNDDREAHLCSRTYRITS